jgi:hypothetical protein
VAASLLADTDEEQQAKLNVNKSDKGWQRVSYRKKQTNNYRYVGKSGNARDFNFRAADKKVPIFITNIHRDTMEDDIVRYIQSKTNDLVSLERINMKVERDHKAYKFFVTESKLSSYLDANIWPQGIVFRRFNSFKYRHANKVLPNDGLTNGE